MILLRVQDNTSSAGKSLVCEHCDSGDLALSRCIDCCVFMCEFCITAHKRINATKGHQLLTLEEVKRLGSKALVKPAICKKHSETLKLLCQTCQETICRDCTIVDHRDHKYEFVADVAEKERKVVQGILLETKAKDRTAEGGLKAVQKMESCIQSKITEVNKEVDAFFDEQVKALEYMRGNLKHEVTTQGQIKLKQLGSQKEVLSLSLAQLRSGVDFAERALADGNDIELLSMKKHLVERLAKLSTLQLQCKPCRTDYLKFQVNKTMWDIGEMATIHYSLVDPRKCVLSMVGGEEGVIYQTLAGQSVDFVLVINDEHAVKNPSDFVVCALVSHERTNTLQEVPIRDSGNGCYIFSYCPEIDGVSTLSVMVDGKNVHGSPFTWKVKPRVQSTDQLTVLTSSQEQGSPCKGQHCWKVKVGLLSQCNKLQRVEIGVSCMKQADYTEIKRCSWFCQVGWKTGCQFSRSDSPHAAAITSLFNGDVFSVYLNFDSKKLILYNARSKNAEVFTGLKGELILPIISPLIEDDSAQQTGFSLNVK